MERVERLLEELTNAYGPPGFEEPVRAIMRRELSPVSDSIETDGMGSLIARLRGGQDSPRVMLAAHMDEVGLLVKYVTQEGFVKFQPLGGWLDHALINQRFVILARNGPVHGVTGLKTPHVIAAEQRATLAFKWQQMFLDVGATSRKDAEERLGIQPGDPIAPESKFQALAGGQCYLAKAWDDRVGLAVMVEAMSLLSKRPPPNAVYAVSTVQEEVGLRGAHTSANLVRPDVGINLEAGVAADYPGTSQEEAQERLGGGPGLFLHDSSMLPNLKFRDLVVDVAREQGISLQFEVLSGYGQDGAEMQRAYAGIPTINITVPTRYLHNHNGVISRQDFDGAVALVSEVVRRLDADTVRRLRSFD
ncbi:MAG: M42 family metallopeptidase [Chloroflexi bacterium]|nr:M42 family metallopeptidase [Chloroflexota bacterium]